MACGLEILKGAPLFALLDDDELAVLAEQVELRTFAAAPAHLQDRRRRRARLRAWCRASVRVTTIDEDQQDVVVDEPAAGEFFGFASMLEQTPHQTNAMAIEETVCIEVDRHDIADAAAAEAARRHGHADRARPAVPCRAAAGARARRPQSERDHRSGGDLRRTDRRRGGAASAAPGPSSSRSCGAGHLHRHQRRAAGHAPGIRIRSSC